MNTLKSEKNALFGGPGMSVSAIKVVSALPMSWHPLNPFPLA